jgi:UDP-N-acetylglucosamine:LPS N-acetylglucosamine transferase
VIEEKNLSGTILIAEIDRILSSPEILEKMKKGALKFAPRDASYKIAKGLIAIGLEHE